MPQLASKLNPRAVDFQANAAAMRAQVDDLNAQLERVAQGGPAAARGSRRPRFELSAA